jgi:hypothetical protein
MSVTFEEFARYTFSPDGRDTTRELSDVELARTIAETGNLLDAAVALSQERGRIVAPTDIAARLVSRSPARLRGSRNSARTARHRQLPSSQRRGSRVGRTAARTKPWTEVWGQDAQWYALSAQARAGQEPMPQSWGCSGPSQSQDRVSGLPGGPQRLVSAIGPGVRSSRVPAARPLTPTAAPPASTGPGARTCCAPLLPSPRFGRFERPARLSLPRRRGANGVADDE